MRKECVITSYSSVKSCDFLSLIFLKFVSERKLYKILETRSYVLLIKGFTSFLLS